MIKRLFAILFRYDKKLLDAAETDDVWEATRLLDAGANVNARNKEGETPLHCGIIGGTKELIELLIEHGADIEAKDEDGQTPLHLAAFYGSREVAEVLVAHGADVNARDEDGQAPLHSVAMEDARDVAEFLIAHGAEVDSRDGIGQTPLHRAAFYGSREVIEVLVAHGADITLRDGNGGTLLHGVCFAAVVREELENDIPDAEPEEEDSWDALEGFVDLLLAKGADVNARNKSGNTPLDKVAELKDTRLADLIRKHGGMPGKDIG